MGTTTTTQRVAANVRAELAARKISGSTLAAAVNVAPSTMYRRLDGSKAWPVDEVEAVADYLGVSVLSLFAAREVAA